MSQNTTAIMNAKTVPVYAGLDIAKASLQLHLQTKSYDLANTTEGHTQLLKRLAALPGAHVLCEATGGYERAVVAALHAANLVVSVINPARVRQFARASGELAKTDPIDATDDEVASILAPRIAATPLRVEVVFTPISQGSSCLATLGWRTQSLRDWPKFEILRPPFFPKIFQNPWRDWVPENALDG